jgi:hypothetical protein
MSRICPKCKAKLGGYDSFFCSMCGESLPTDLINRNGMFSRIANFAGTSKETPERKFNIRSVVYIKGLITAIVVALLIAGGYYYVKNGLGNDLFTPQPEEVTESSSTPTDYTKNVADANLNWEVNTFGIDAINSYVPYASDIVIEGNDLYNLGISITALDPTYKELFNFINGKAEQHFVLFAKEIDGRFAWSLVYLPTQSTYVVPADLIARYPSLKFGNSGKAAFVTTEESQRTEILDVINRSSKNFTQNQIYTASKVTSPRNGKLFIYLNNQKAKEYFSSIGRLPKLPKDLKMVVESVSKENSDYSIIL